MIIQFSAQRLIGSAAIRYFTWSPYSHVDFVLPNGMLLGARAARGVALYSPAEWQASRVATYSVATNIRQQEAILRAARSQIGKPYDWGGVLGIALRSRRWQADDSWFCSELVTWAFEQAGVPLLRTTDAWRITPRDLLLSPHLKSSD